MTASVEIEAGADLVAIAVAAGTADPQGRYYRDGWLYVLGVSQEALEAALAQVGTAAPVGPRIHAVFQQRVAEGLPVAGRGGAVALDPDSRRELTAAALMASLGGWPAQGFWRLTDNTNLPLTGPQVVALGQAAAGRYQVLFAVRSGLLDAAAAGQVVDPDAGWPAAAPFDPAG